MDVVERVPVPTGDSAPGGSTNAYLVGRDRPILVDPGARSTRLDELVRSRSVTHIVATHTHPDHVGALGAYAAETNATVWARGGRESRFRTETGRAPDKTYAEGTQIGGPNGLTVLETPGHAPDHVAFLLRDSSGARFGFVGDLVFAEGSVFVGKPDGDMRTYLVSLRRLRTRELDRLYPGHGQPIDAPMDRIDALLAHRRERERRVLAAISDGATSMEEILEGAYDQDLSGVEELAARSVSAHISKLIREGHLDRDPTTNRPWGEMDEHE
jgi:ribonuclease/clavin/mitogillin